MALKPNEVVLSGVRSAFLVLGEPEDYQGNKKFRWSATGLIPYGADVLKKIDAAMMRVATAKWHGKARAILDACLDDKQTTCLLNGKKKPEYEGYEGHMALTAHRPVKSGRPMVIDTDLTPIYFTEDDLKKYDAQRKEDPEMPKIALNELVPGKAGRIYAGAFVNMKVGFWAQDNDNGKAIRAELLTIQTLGRGDSFGGGAKPTADDFAMVEDGADDDDLS